jgi:hypothetical protein
MSFDLQLARQCLVMSRRAYREASFTHAPTSTEVLVWSLNGQAGELVVAFRGSKEPLDYIMDAKFIGKERWPGHGSAGLHRGFWEGYKAVANQVASAVQFADRIVITGHSLGGARAMICGAHLVELGWPVSDVITFGAPRVGNAAFRDFYNEELHDDTIRFEAQGDPVPWSPPWLLNGYRHVGRSAYLKNDGSVQIDPVWWTRPAQYALTKLPTPDPRPSTQLFGLFDPHDLTNYERLLANAKEAA